MKSSARTSSTTPSFRIRIAWQIATDKRLEKPDLALAEKCAVRANTATKGQDIGVLDALARIKFMAGQKDEAVKLMEQALAEVDDEQLKNLLTTTLASYRKGELPVIPEQSAEEEQ